MMFRTKSLTSQQMKSLIQRNRPSQIHKQNRNYSLRSLIADKTIKYQKHMEKLIGQSNNIQSSYSGHKKTTQNVNRDYDEHQKSKSNRKLIVSNKRHTLDQLQNNKQYSSIVRQLEQMVIDQGHDQANNNHLGLPNQFTQESTINIRQHRNQIQQQSRQFLEEVQIVYVSSLPTYLGSNQQKQSCRQSHLQNESVSRQQLLDADVGQSRTKTKEMEKSCIKLNLQKQQLFYQNKELRRQIQYLQQRLQTAELIRIQKQSQSQSLRLKLKILELKIQDYEQKQQQRQEYWTKFCVSKPYVQHIGAIHLSNVHCETQTQETFQYIGQILLAHQHKSIQLGKLLEQISDLQHFINWDMVKIDEQIVSNNNKSCSQFHIHSTSQILPNLMQKLFQNNAKLKQKLTTQQKQLNQMRNAYNNLTLEYNKIQQSKTIYGRLIEQKEYKVAQLEGLCQNLQKDVHILSNQRDITIKKVRQHQQFGNKIIGQLNQGKQRIQALENDCNQYARYLEEMNAKNRELQQQINERQNKYKSKIGNLVNLLQLAQKQIKNLLTKLRQAKDHDIANYKEIMHQVSGKISNVITNSFGVNNFEGGLSVNSSKQL